ncbi:MAG: hypothetical protein Q9207_008342 [Kuettlingeria erythrocarpa]
MARSKNTDKPQASAENLTPVQRDLNEALRALSVNEAWDYRYSLQQFARLLRQRKGVFKTECLKGYAWNQADTPLSDMYDMLRCDTRAPLKKSEGWQTEPRLELSQLSQSLDQVEVYVASLTALVALLGQREECFRPQYDNSRTPISRLYTNLANDTIAMWVKVESWRATMVRWGYYLEDVMWWEAGYPWDPLG